MPLPCTSIVTSSMLSTHRSHYVCLNLISFVAFDIIDHIILIACVINPLTSTLAIGVHPVPDQVKLSFVIFDIWPLWRSGLIFRMPGWAARAVAAPPPFRHGDPAVCGSHTLVTPYCCRLGDLLCCVYLCIYYFLCYLCNFVFLQYFDAVGWVFWPVKPSSR